MPSFKRIRIQHSEKTGSGSRKKSTYLTGSSILEKLKMHLIEVHEEDGGGYCDDNAGDASVELQLRRTVPEAVPGDQHLGVHVLNYSINQYCNFFQ